MPLLENLKRQFDHFVKSPQDILEEDALPQANHFQISNSIYFQKNENETNLKKGLALSNSFVEMHKSAYSHGLEKTYAIETININSIRKLHVPSPKTPTPSNDPIPVFQLPASNQLEFDFGQGFREWISPLFLDESIRSLGLTPLAEKCLEKNGKWKLRDLLGNNFQDLVFLKGMGQGHIDEIQSTLKNYVNNRSLQHEYVLSWESWIKSLSATFERKKSYIFLEKFDLSDLISLTPAENVEVKRLAAEKKEAWLAEAEAYFLADESQVSVQRRMQEMVDAFIKPWMMRRGGLATTNELSERLKKVSSMQKWFEPGFHFFNHLYFKERPCFELYLIELEPGLFCANATLAQLYQNIIARSHSYFYQASARYLMGHFLTLLEHEYLKEGEAFSHPLAEKMLRSSGKFCVRKGMSKQLEIRLLS
jgi:hypothetical protein